MFLLDTNIVSHIAYRPERFPNLLRNIRATRFRDRWISVVTAEEVIGGWLLHMWELKRARRQQLLDAYYYFRDGLAVVHYYHNLIKEFDDAAYDEFQGMPGEVGGNDRRMAAIALANDFTLVSHDRDFSLIQAARPDLRIQDWVDTDYSEANSRLYSRP